MSSAADQKHMAQQVEAMAALHKMVSELAAVVVDVQARVKKLEKK